MREFHPHPYQRMMIEHARKVPRCALWAGMGMGKTSSTLHLVDGLMLTGEVKRPLVLAPKRVALSTWPSEAKKWAQFSGMRIRPIIGDVQERAAALTDRTADLYTINYDNLPWLVEILGDRWPFDMVIADESTRLKAFRTRQGGKRAGSIASAARFQVQRWINLTGTPAPNGLQDLWGQTYFLDFGKRLGATYTDFENRWFGFQRAAQAVTAHKTFIKRVVFPHSQAEIQDRLKDICLTLDPKDWFDLDEPIIHTVNVNLPPHARKHYREMEKELFTYVKQLQERGEEIDSEVEAFSIASRDIKCLQIASGAIYTKDKEGIDTGLWAELHDEKIEALKSIVEEAAGMPVLVAYHFKHDLARLKDAFPQGRVLDANPKTIEQWDAGEIPVLFAHPDSAGHGLNLQDGGNILVYFSHWWALEARQQILERIGPMRQKQSGHDRPVFVYNIVTKDTIDEDVIMRVETKKSVQETLMDAMKRRAE